MITTPDPESIAARGGVVLLHGIARSPRSMAHLDQALRSAGYRTLNLAYASRDKPLDALAEDIDPAIEGFAATLDGPIHFVTHSMGGLLVRAYLARHRPARLGRVVMLAPPNSGSEVADALRGWRPYRWFFGPAGQQLTTQRYGGANLPPVDFELGVIAGSRTVNPLLSLLLLPGPNDGKVTVAGTRVAGMADHLTVAASHTFLPMHPAAIAGVLAFLADGHLVSGKPRDPDRSGG